MANLFGSGTNKKVTGKAADSGYDATKSTVPKLQVQLPNLQNLFQSGASGTGRQVTGKAADSNYTGSKTTSSLPRVQSAGGVSNSGYTAPKATSSTTRVQSPALQTTTQNPGASGTTRQVTGKAADSGYTPEKKQASQQANRQIVQNWWNNEQAKSAQDNSTDRAYTAKLTGGANIDNSAEVMKSLQRTFGGASDSAETQYDRTLKSKMGYGRNWSNPRSAVGNAIESGVAGTVAGYLNALGTALKSDQRSGLAVDSGKVDVRATGNEWYNRAGSYLQEEADWARMLSENAYLRGSRNLNNAQTLLFDGTVAGTQMAGDIALGTLTGGSAMIPMALRSFGNASQQARQAGATENQQIVYGAASALKEALTEKLFDGLARAYGKGSADDFVDDLARNLTKSEGGQALLRGLLNTGGEGAEEVISGFVDPALQGIYNGKTLGENYRELNMADLMHDGAVGMLLGNLGGSVDMAQTGSGQVSSYADALRKIQSEQNATALGTNADSFDARYQELERKYLNGSISPDEGEELWKLEHMKGQFSKPSEHVGIAPKSAEWDAQKKSRELESDSLISMGRKARAMLTGNKAIAFSSLPGKMKVEFEERLSSAYPDVETALRKICSSAKYRLGTDQRSFYTSSKVEKDGVIIDEDTITIGTRGSASTIAHELFHKLDKEGVIGSELSDSLMQDYIALNIQSNGDIKSYLSLKFQTAFVQSLDGDLVMKPEYAGISDILNGLSGGTISYGYGHKKGYWADSGSLEAETWADFGRTYYDNKSDVINMFEEIFPNLSKKAKEKLKELL